MIFGHFWNRKKWIFGQNFFREIDLFDFTSFFVWTFLNFLTHYATDDDEKQQQKQQKQKEKLQKIIDDFVKDGSSKKELHCSSELTSYERMVLHELANIAQLSHASEGEGKTRHIVLRKNNLQVSNNI